MARVRYESDPVDPASARQMWLIKMILWTAYMSIDGDSVELLNLDRKIVDVPIDVLRKRFTVNGRPFPWIDGNTSAQELADNLGGVIEAAVLFEG